MNTISALEPYEKAGLPSAFLKRMHFNMLEQGSCTYSKPPRVTELFRAEDTPEGHKFWLYVQLDFKRICQYKDDAEHLIEFLLEQDRQGNTLDMGVWCNDPYASAKIGGINFSKSVKGFYYWVIAAAAAKALIARGELMHEPENTDCEPALATESHTADLFTPVHEAEQPKPHVGTSGIRGHSCGMLYPHVIIHRGKIDELKKNIIIAGYELACPDMPNAELKVWADELADAIKAGKISSFDGGELCKPVMIEHFKRQGYDTPMAELIVMRHKQERGYYSFTGTQTVQNSFYWAKTPEGTAFWEAVSRGEIKKLTAHAKNLPVDARAMAVLFCLQYKQNGEFNRSALVNYNDELSIKNKFSGGVNLGDCGLVDLYCIIYYSPSESLMAAVTSEFLNKAYQHLTK